MFNIRIGKEEIVDSVDQLPSEEKLEFIRAVDNAAQDWEFTKSCFEYFSREMLQYFDENSFEHGALRTLLLMED